MRDEQHERIGVGAGPDLFGFYLREVVDLLTHDDEDNYQGLYSGSHVVNPLFSNALNHAIPDSNRDLLNTSLRQGVVALTREVDEMIDPVLRIRRIISCLRSKKHHSRQEAVLDRGLSSLPCKKQKKSTSNGQRETGNAEEEIVEVDEHLKFLLENENKVELEAIVTKHSDELEETLMHMERKLEELLDAVVSKCRPMTRQEKQQLGILIQKLPAKNLDRIADIIHAGKSSDSKSDEISVDLERQDNAILWRLYFYVKAVENARKLSR